MSAKRSTGGGEFESGITSTPYYSGRVVIVRCTQFCNLKELLCSLQKILGSYMAFKSFRANKWLGIDDDLGIGDILERVLDHRSCRNGRQGEERKETVHDDSALPGSMQDVVK